MWRALMCVLVKWLILAHSFAIEVFGRFGQDWFWIKAFSPECAEIIRSKMDANPKKQGFRFRFNASFAAKFCLCCKCFEYCSVNSWRECHPTLSHYKGSSTKGKSQSNRMIEGAIARIFHKYSQAQCSEPPVIKTSVVNFVKKSRLRGTTLWLRG